MNHQYEFQMMMQLVLMLRLQSLRWCRHMRLEVAQLELLLRLLSS
jgi:hypothetical protein